MSGLVGLKTKLNKLLEKDKNELKCFELKNALLITIKSNESRELFKKYVSPYLFYLRSQPLDMFYSALFSNNVTTIKDTLDPLVEEYVYGSSDDLRRVISVVSSKVLCSFNENVRIHF